MLKILNRYVPAKSILLAVTENLWITTALVMLVELHDRFDPAASTPGTMGTAARIAFITFLYQTCFFYNDLYDMSVVATRRELTIRMFQSVGAGALVLGLLYVLFPSLMIGDGVGAASVLLGILGLMGWRLLIGACWPFYSAPRKVLVLGTDDLAVDLVRSILRHPGLNMKVVGFLSDRREMVGVSLVNPEVVGMLDEVEEVATRLGADRVVVALADRRNTMPVRALFNLKLRGVTVEDAHSLFERVNGKIRTTALPPSWLIFSDGFKKLSGKVRRKRVLDFFFSLVAGLMALPVAVVVAILVKLDSAGPALFRQERVGRHGTGFTLYKFRTMRVDAEADGVPQWAAERDPRVTRLGKWLRETRLDEIPQIWNVLAGEMSLVGPRPERPYFVNQLREKLSYYDERHTVRPGVTGWAQVYYPYGASVEDALQKLQYDLFYVKNMSLLMDLAILFETGKIVMFGRGR